MTKAPRRVPFRSNNCQPPHSGNIVKFTPGTHEDLLLAGVWDKWTDHATGEIIFSFAILTDNPSDCVLSVGHDRQPVFLNLANADAWLNTEALPSAEAYTFLKHNQETINYSVIDYKPLKGFKKDDLFG